jgi:hypothetical protein
MGDAVMAAAYFKLEMDGSLAGRERGLHEHMGHMRCGDGATGALGGWIRTLSR